VVDVLEGNRTYVSQNRKGEPQLGKRNLYHAVGGQTNTDLDELAMLWVLNLADGDHSLLDTAERSGCAFWDIRRAADALRAHDLLRGR
jgi:aminopeptidase-like protein